MNNKGVVTELKELIALRQEAQLICKPRSKGQRLHRYESHMRGRGMDIADIRHYQVGDEVRHMEWHITARTGRPHVKTYHEERERPVVILIDFNPSMYFGTRESFKSVVAARLAAILAWVACKCGDRIGGLMFSPSFHQEFTPKGQPSAVLPFLAALSRCTKEYMGAHLLAAKPLNQSLIRLERVTHPGSIVVLISDFYTMDKDCEQHLNRLRAHNNIISYHIIDPLELTAPKPQRYLITNGADEFFLDTTASSVTQAYQDYWKQRLFNLQQQFRRLKIEYEQVTATMDLSLLVRQTFPWSRHV
ncbi:MAG: DUF58 domain-containing protein [Legionella sp.]